MLKTIRNRRTPMSVLLVLLLVLSACGNPNDPSDTTAASGEPSETTGEQPETTGEGTDTTGESEESTPEASGGDVVFAQSTDITFLDPAGNQPQNYPAGYEAAYAIYSGLVRFDADLQFQPDLATDWELADDGVTWTFHLRDDVTFHDGTPFNADAVVAHFTRMLDPEVNLSAYPLWSPIASVEKIDDYTVTVVTAEPYGALLNTMAHGSGLIPSPAAVEEYGEDFGLNPVGTGPYKLKNFDPGSSLVVEAYADYHGEAPPYSSITYTHVGDAAGRIAALLSGQAQFIDAVPVQEADRLAQEANIVDRAGLQTFGLGLSQNHPALTDKTVRQALNYAIDKEGIVQALFRGRATVLDSPLAPNTTGHATAGSYAQDQAKAAEMLAEAGYTAGDDGVLQKDGVRLSFVLRASEGLFPNDIQVAQAVQDQLKAIGVEVEIDQVDAAAFFDSLKVARSEATFDMVLFGFNPSHASGLLQLDAQFYSNPSEDVPQVWNFMWYSNPDVDAAIDAARRSADPEVRDGHLAEAQQILWDDAPYIWLYVRNIISAHDDSVQPPVVLPVLFTLPSSVG